jgi:hypothetical protein
MSTLQAMQRCATCRHWRTRARDFEEYALGGVCDAAFASGDSLGPLKVTKRPLTPNGVMVDGSWREYIDELVTGPQFGCVLHQASDTSSPGA